MVEEIQPSDYVILELSSFQLFDLDRISAAPDVAVVTNFSPNHLDWHGSIENYRHAKQTILRRQSENQTAILNADDADVSSWKTNAIRIEFGQDKADSELELAIRDSFKQPGAHNFQNALAACCAANAVGIPLDAIKRGLQQFQPLEHRLQFVAEVNGRRFYNDSKATTPESAIAAIESFDSPVVLLAGGYDKQIDLAAFANTISQRCKAVALMGETATELDQLISADINSQICESFEDSFRWAVEQSNPGDVVLLSPGCASYDWFPDFEARGNQFVQLVGEWTDGMPSA
jgi:UDP-N-acetylmuramoylalanine--D-glutamate ligase